MYQTAGLKKEVYQEEDSGPAAVPEVDAFGYYEALGLDPRRRSTVSAEDVKAAFRKAARSMHPDKFSNSDEEDRLMAEENFKKVGC